MNDDGGDTLIMYTVVCARSALCTTEWSSFLAPLLTTTPTVATAAARDTHHVLRACFRAAAIAVVVGMHTILSMIYHVVLLSMIVRHSS